MSSAPSALRRDEDSAEPGRPREVVPLGPPARRRRPSLAAKLLLAAGAMLFALLVGEVALRLFGNLPNNHHRLFCEYDPLLGWRKIPNARGWHITPEYRVLEAFNSRGLRGPEYSYEKPAGVYRILMLGDSFAEGYSVDFEELHSERLGHLLSERSGRRVEVINAGTGGYSTDQELLFFESEGRKYEPDLIVLLFYDNDPLYNAETRYFRGQKPMFLLGEDGALELTNVPPPPPRRSLRRRAADWLLDNVQVARLGGLVLRDLPRLHGLAARIGLTGPPSEPAAEVPFESKVYLRSEPADLERRWEVTAALLARLRDSGREVGAPLVIFYAPSRVVAEEEICRALESAYGVPPESCRRDGLADRLEGLGRELELEFVDPLEAFRGERARGVVHYHASDGHWNGEGNRLVAELLAERIEARLGVPGP